MDGNALSTEAKKRRFGLRDTVAIAYCRHGYLLALEEVERELKTATARRSDAA
jgi:hypothetical protein